MASDSILKPNYVLAEPISGTTEFFPNLILAQTSSAGTCSSLMFYLNQCWFCFLCGKCQHSEAPQCSIWTQRWPGSGLPVDSDPSSVRECYLLCIWHCSSGAEISHQSSPALGMLCFPQVLIIFGCALASCSATKGLRNAIPLIREQTERVEEEVLLWCVCVCWGGGWGIVREREQEIVSDTDL